MSQRPRLSRCRSRRRESPSQRGEFRRSGAARVSLRGCLEIRSIARGPAAALRRESNRLPHPIRRVVNSSEPGRTPSKISTVRGFYLRLLGSVRIVRAECRVQVGNGRTRCRLKSWTLESNAISSRSTSSGAAGSSPPLRLRSARLPGVRGWSGCGVGNGFSMISDPMIFISGSALLRRRAASSGDGPASITS